MVRGECRGGAASASVETVGAYSLFRQPDACYEVFEGAEFQCCQAEAARNLVDHALIFGSAGRSVAVEIIGRLAAFEILDDTACDEFEVAFRRGEADIFAAVDQRRTRNAGVDFPASSLIEGRHVVAELSAAHYRVVAENNALVFQQGPVRYELHLRHKGAARLVARCEAARPCRRVFQHGAVVGNSATFAVAEGETDARVGNAADTVGFSVVFLSHGLSGCLAHKFGVDVVVVAGGEPVVNP